jgi:hypothetical protein
MGQKVYKSSFTEAEHVIPIKNFAEGVYLIAVKSKSGILVRKKLIVDNK